MMHQKKSRLNFTSDWIIFFDVVTLIYHSTPATAGLHVERHTVHVCDCTGTTVNVHNLLHCSPVTTLCQLKCGVAEVCALSNAL